MTEEQRHYGDAVEMKPCPFCGNPEPDPPEFTNRFVRCRLCGCRGPSADGEANGHLRMPSAIQQKRRQALIDAWNERP